MLGKFRNLFELRKPDEDAVLIHPKFTFREVDRFWRWNEVPNMIGWALRKTPMGENRREYTRPHVKLAFAFDNPELLDDCPFLCKIGRNLKGDTKYFGVAYGTKYDVEKLKEWSQRFVRSELLTYDSKPYSAEEKRQNTQ